MSEALKKPASKDANALQGDDLKALWKFAQNNNLLFPTKVTTQSEFLLI